MRVVWLGTLLALGLSGCLVTDPIEFEDEVGSPPALVTDPNENKFLGRIVSLNNDDPTSWTFSLQVRDADVTQDLQAHWRIVKDGMPSPAFEPTIELPSTGTPTRSFDVVLQSTQLTDYSCQRIDVAISGSFYDRDAPEYFALPRDEGDLAFGSWWIWKWMGDEALATDMDRLTLFGSCETRGDLFPVPTMGAAGAAP